MTYYPFLHPRNNVFILEGGRMLHDVKVIYTLQYVSTSSLLQSPNNKNKSNLHAVPLIKGTFYLRIQEITLYGMLTLM